MYYNLNNELHDGNVCGVNVLQICVKKEGVLKRLHDMSDYSWERL